MGREGRGVETQNILRSEDAHPLSSPSDEVGHGGQKVSFWSDVFDGLPLISKYMQQQGKTPNVPCYI